MRRLPGGLSLLITFVLIPALGVVEHLTRVKMGMYRYVVMKNDWLLKNIFTPEALPFLWGVPSLLLMWGIHRKSRPEKDRDLRWYLWRLYATLLLVGELYLFDAGRFAGLRAGPWFGLALLAAGALWLLQTLLPGRNDGSLRDH